MKKKTGWWVTLAILAILSGSVLSRADEGDSTPGDGTGDNSDNGDGSGITPLPPGNPRPTPTPTNGSGGNGSGPVIVIGNPGYGNGPGGGDAGGIWPNRIVRLERIMNNLEKRIMKIEEQLSGIPGGGPGGYTPQPRPTYGVPNRDVNPTPVNGNWRCLIQDQNGTPFVARASSQQDAVNAVITLCLRFRQANQCVPNVQCTADGNQ